MYKGEGGYEKKSQKKTCKILCVLWLCQFTFVLTPVLGHLRSLSYSHISPPGHTHMHQHTHTQASTQPPQLATTLILYLALQRVEFDSRLIFNEDKTGYFGVYIIMQSNPDRTHIKALSMCQPPASVTLTLLWTGQMFQSANLFSDHQTNRDSKGPPKSACHPNRCPNSQRKVQQCHNIHGLVGQIFVKEIHPPNNETKLCGSDPAQLKNVLQGYITCAVSGSVKQGEIKESCITCAISGP